MQEIIRLFHKRERYGTRIDVIGVFALMVSNDLQSSKSSGREFYSRVPLKQKLPFMLSVLERDNCRESRNPKVITSNFILCLLL